MKSSQPAFSRIIICVTVSQPQFSAPLRPARRVACEEGPELRLTVSIRVGGGDTKKDLFLQITLANLKSQNSIFSKDNCVEIIKKSQKFETCRTFEV